MKSNINTLELVSRLDSLILFRSLLDEPFFMKLKDLLIQDSIHDSIYDWGASAKSQNLSANFSSYSIFAHELFSRSVNLSRQILNFVIFDENIYLLSKAKGKPVAEVLEKTLLRELQLFQEISRLQPEDIKMFSKNSEFLPGWEVESIDFVEEYRSRINSLGVDGYGIYRKYHMFTFRNGQISPVKYPDQQSLSDLIGYERERQLVMQNTEALLRGFGASNVLLYGDSGTGKSSTVKAVANFFRDQGLRLVEITKNQLYQLPDIIEILSENPLKFIIFIDDLSFTKNDDNFSTLKAMLEGSVSGKKNNIAIYATSNRRHLVKESMSDRRGDELFLNDTLQEIMSLSARFGLAITFERPRKDQYLQIVHYLAQDANLNLDQEELEKRAEAHALLCGGRSPRVARQFIELLISGISL